MCQARKSLQVKHPLPLKSYSDFLTCVFLTNENRMDTRNKEDYFVSHIMYYSKSMSNKFMKLSL